MNLIAVFFVWVGLGAQFMLWLTWRKYRKEAREAWSEAERFHNLGMEIYEQVSTEIRGCAPRILAELERAGVDPANVKINVGVGGPGGAEAPTMN